MALHAKGEKAISLTGPQAGVVTDGLYSKARIVDVNSRRIKEELEKNDIIIVAGFQGISENFDITTLGRGGSDTSAVAIAAALDAKVCEIYTDVPGVFSADPRIVKNAIKLKEISFDDMLQLSVFGSKVLNPRSVELAKAYNIPIHLRSSLEETEGTYIREEMMFEKDRVISGIAHDYDIVKMAIFNVPNKPGIASKIFKELAKENINVRIIIQSASEKEDSTDIAFTVDLADKDDAKKCLENVLLGLDAKKIIVEDGLAMLTIVGSGLISRPGSASEAFDVLAENSINIDMISTSEATICTVIAAKDCEKATQKLTEYFGLTEK